MKVTVTVEHDDGSTSTSVYPVAEAIELEGKPVYRKNAWPPEMVSCWFGITFNALMDDNGFNCYTTTERTAP